MTDPYIQINGTKIELFDNDLNDVRTLQELSDGKYLKTDVIAEKTPTVGVTIDGTLIKDGGATLATPVINTAISGTAIATGAEVTAGTDNTKIVTPKAIGDAAVNTRLKSKILTFTRDMEAASGDVSYTGLDFTPTSIQAFATIIGTYSFSIGFADSAKASRGLGASTVGIMGSGTELLVIYTTADHFQTAIVKSFDANVGFTLTWVRGNDPTGIAALSFSCTG